MESLEEVESLTNLEVKASEVLKVRLNLVNGEINKHTSDLGGKTLTNELFDVAVDEFSDHLLEVGVLGEDSGEQVETLLVVGINLGVLALKVSGTGGWDDNDLRGGILVTSGDWLRDLLDWSGSLRASLAWSTTLHSLPLVRSVVVLRAGGSDGVLRASHVSLDESEDLLDELDGVGSLKERWVNGSSSLSLHVQEISLILGVSLDLLADLGKLVVGDKEVLAVDGLVVKV